ncbi:MAG: thioredoxin [Candidatus Aminicenantes bacterium]|jgi:thioredoxin 1
MKIEVKDTDFSQKVLKADVPCLVDFWAEWCAPCHFIAPVLEQIAEEYEGKLNVCKLNVDDNPGTAEQYAIMAIPTLLVFNQGELVEKIVGVKSKEEIEKTFEPFVN